MSAEQRDPAVCKGSNNTGGKGEMTKAPSSLQDLRGSLYVQAKVEPIFEADFQSGSYGYRPKRTAHQAVNRVAQAIVEEKTRIIDIDLRAYFDNVQHFLLLEKVARRVQDDAVMLRLSPRVRQTVK